MAILHRFYCTCNCCRNSKTFQCKNLTPLQAQKYISGTTSDTLVLQVFISKEKVTLPITPQKKRVVNAGVVAVSDSCFKIHLRSDKMWFGANTHTEYPYDCSNRKVFAMYLKRNNEKSNVNVIRGAFGKFLAWSFISVTDLHTLSCLVSF